MKRALLIIGILVLAGLAYVHWILPGQTESSININLPHDAYTVSERAQRLHDSLFIADLHSDSLLWKRDLQKRSDIGHMDAPDMTKVVEDSYSLVEKKVLSNADYRRFMADNPIRLHGRMNRDFWKGTAVEDYAEKVLSKDAAWAERR